MSSSRVVVGIAVLLFGFMAGGAVPSSSSVLLPAAAAEEEQALSLADWAKKSQGRFAYGMYMKGKKVGYVIEEWKVGQHEGKPVLRSTSETYMKTLFDGEVSVSEEKTLTFYELAGDGPIVFAEVRRKEDGQLTERSVVRDGKKGLKITARQGKRVMTRTVPTPRDDLASQRKLEAWLKGPRKADDTFVRYSADWDLKEVDKKHVCTYKATKTILLAGLKTPVHVVQVNIDGGKMDLETRSDGRILSCKVGDLLSMKLEKEAEAKSLSKEPVDLLALSAIVVDRKLGPARHVDELTLKMTGLGDFRVPTSHRQKATRKDGETTVVEMRRDYRLDKADPLSRQARKEHLEATPRLQVDEEAIVNLAKKIVGDEKDKTKAIRKLQTWVYENLKKSYSDAADSALSVLDRKAGACKEHTLLFVALARAAGVPAREVAGVAYIQGARPLFGWHAWAEAHDGHQWVSVDPTWNQVYVDATHIKMAEGEKDQAWTNVASTLKIEIVKAVVKGGKKDREK